MRIDRGAQIGHKLHRAGEVIVHAARLITDHKTLGPQSQTGRASPCVTRDFEHQTVIGLEPSGLRDHAFVETGAANEGGDKTIGGPFV